MFGSKREKKKYTIEKTDEAPTLNKNDQVEPIKDSNTVKKPKKKVVDYTIKHATKQTKNEFIADCFSRSMLVSDDECWRAYVTNETTVVFADSGKEMLGYEFLEEVASALSSFPDLRFTWSKFTEISPGVVTSSSLVAEGTHTGEPYGFGPFPAIKAKGTKCKDPPLTVTGTIENGKIVHWHLDGGGELCGPPSFYTQIGGIVM
jgi:hypothetical protein